MVAVLLMMAILLVGILFVALVTYNQSQSERHEHTLAAQAMAEAGIRYATYMLENSPEGADWRPPEPPMMDTTGAMEPDVYGPDGVPGTEDDYYTDTELARGWAPVVSDLGTPDVYIQRGFSRFPDPRHPAGGAGVSTTPGAGYFFLRVSYDPWDPNTDRDPANPADSRRPDPLDWHIKIEAIGRVEGSEVYRSMVAYKPVPMLNYARWVHDATGEGRPAFFGVPAYLDMDNDGAIQTSPVGTEVVPPEWISTAFDGPIRVNGRLQVAGTPYDTGTEIFGSTQFNLYSRMARADLNVGEFPRDDSIEVTGGIDYLNVVDGAEVTVADDSGSETRILLPSDDPDFDSFGGVIRDGQSGLSGTGDPRFAARLEPPRLTLSPGTSAFDRYRALTRGSGSLVSVGGVFVDNGQWGFGKGIYIDNFTDIQFDHDIQALIDDWQRPGAAAGTPMPDSGWNALFTSYVPPAVEIEFLPEELPAGDFVTGPSPVGMNPGQLWWPGHEAGQPGIKITRHDRTWRTPDGVDSGQRTIVLDYPTPWLDGSDDTERHPLIVAEGNIRVSGQLPPAIESAGETARVYDVTVVSGGTIYIDGQLLAPNDYLPDADRVSVERNTRIALLARDSVCLNTTRIVPQDTFGTAPAGPDDPLNPADPNKHWELAPGGDGRGYSLFYWGAEPLGDSAALVVRQAAADPGPSGVSLTTWIAGDAYTAYVFGDAPDPMVDETFALVPEGTVFPDGVSTPPQPYGVAAIAPQWAPYRLGAANLPWDLAGYLDPTPGLKNAIMLRHADPHLGAGSTSYWLKKWKVAEYNGNGLPVGAINARVNAAVFAERGCWYVLTNGYFDGEQVGPDAVRNRRYNYRITFNGTIAENFTASVEAAHDWTDKLAYPARYEGGTIADLARWGSIEYTFDETLRMARFHSAASAPSASIPAGSNPTHPAANLPRLPLLPVSPDLVYYGD